jgi:two-component system, LytTR family, response regulator
MLKAFVLDDERLAVQRLTRLLQSSGRVDVVGSATDPEDALAFLAGHPVDVLFLDIQMPGLNGFQLLERLEHDVPVVFTTAYDRYALNAFDVNSVDYLLKPIEPERLARALDKIERYRGTGPRTGTGTLQGDLSPSPFPDVRSPFPDVRALAKQLAAELSPAPRLDRLASRVGEKTTILDVARVSHFFAQDKLTFASSGGRDHAIDFTLTDLEARLDGRRFVRIHRATIVNLAFVLELYPGVDGVIARLKDEKKTELSVARDRVRELKTRLGI